MNNFTRFCFLHGMYFLSMSGYIVTLFDTNYVLKILDVFVMRAVTLRSIF